MNDTRGTTGTKHAGTRFATFGCTGETGVGNGVMSYSLIINGYGSIPINTIFRGMNIHLPAILMFTRGTRF